MSSGSTSCESNKVTNLYSIPEKKQSYDAIIQQLNSKPCQKGEVGGGANFMGLFGATTGAAFATNCEQVNLMVDDYYNLKETVLCTLNKTVTTVANSVTIVQEININNGPGGVMNCGPGGLKVENDILADIRILNNVTSEQIDEVKTATQNFIQKTLENTQKSSEAFANPVQGAKDFQLAITSVEDKFKDTKVNEIITDILNEAVAKQTININNQGTIIGDSCSAKNNIVLSVITDNAIQKVGQYVLNQSAVTNYLSDLKSTQDQKTEAPAANLGGLDWWVWLLIIVGVLVVLGLAGWGYNSYSKSNSSNSSSNSNRRKKD